MNLLKHLIIIILAIVPFLTSVAAPLPGKSYLVEKYLNQLKTTNTAVDSIKRMYNIFDLSDRNGQIEWGWKLYETAGRAEDLPTQMDMLRNLAVFHQKDDSIINKLMSLADQIPNVEARNSTKTFILNQRLNRRSRTPDEYTQSELLDSIRSSHNLEGNDVYDRLSLLYQIIQYLGVNADGVLFNECIDKYAQIIDELPSSDYSLKNQFFTTAAMVYSRTNGNPAKAVRYDRQLLKIIEQLQQMYAKKQRKFRNYNSNKYICYRRMLSNYKALDKDEIEAIYDSINFLYDQDTDVKLSMDHYPEPAAYYYTATKDYRNAIPAIQKSLSDKQLSYYQRQKYYAMLMEASRALDERDTYINAMEGYIHNTDKIDSLRRMTITRETLLRDSFMSTPLLFDETALESKAVNVKEKDVFHTLIWISALIAILLIIYSVLYFRLRLKISKH